MVITARDIPGANSSACIIPDRPLLAFDKVRSEGDIVAAVVADNLQIAESAAKLVKVEYKPLPTITSPLDSMKPHTVKIHEKGNIVRHLKLRKGSLEEGFRQADVVVENTYSTQFQDAAPIEPEAGYAIPERNGSVTVVACMQNPHYVRGAVARIIGMPEERVRVVQAATGGTFGTKSDEVAMDICGLTAIASIETGRPVSLSYSRGESMIMHSKRHPFIIKHKTGATKDGKLTAAEIELIADTGAYASNGPLVITRAIFHATGPYVIPNVRVDAYCVYTNNTIAGSFRGFGNPQAHFAAESQMDIIAEKLGMDPLDFRSVNMLRPGTVTATGQLLDDSVGLEECAAKVRDASEWDRKRKEYTTISGRFRKGIGIALLYHGNSIGPEGLDHSTVRVTIEKSGSVHFSTGLTEYGSGARTGLAQIVAEILGIPLAWIKDEVADTATTQDSGGTFASRTTVMGGRAIIAAAETLRRRIDPVAAKLLGCDVTQVQTRDGLIRSNDQHGHSITFRELVAECLRRHVELSEFGEFTASGVAVDENTGQGAPYLQYTFGAVIAEVEVDTLLGLVKPVKFTTAYDVGKAINPLSLEGQIDGGASQGLGYALMEELVHKDGAVVNPNLADYYIPTATDMPEIESFIVEFPGKLGPFGAKAMGEPPIVAPAPALINAIYNATGVRCKSLPATPEKILLALRTERVAKSD
jgi:CO/xanthine dehydrogenase Mo-binding subunit